MDPFDRRSDAVSSPSDRTLGAFIAIPAIVFVLVLVLVSMNRTEGVDNDIILWLHDRSTPWFTRVVTWITDTGGVGRAVPVLAATAYLVATRRRLEATVFVGATLIGQALTFGLKALVQRDRPALFDQASMPTDSSFPSGHALGSTIVFGLIGLWFWQQGRRVAAAVVLTWPPLVAFSRVYLGVHHPSDVIASLAIGTAFVAATLMVYNRLRGGPV